MDNKLPAEDLKRIDLEAKQFAFFNFVSAAHNSDVIFEDIKTWPNQAAACYYSIKNYMIGTGSCWPYERPPLPTEYAASLHMARTLLEKVAFRHEGGLLPDRFIYDEIKTFLDGK